MKTCAWCSTRKGLGQVVDDGGTVWAVGCEPCWKQLEGRPVHQLIKARWVKR